MIQPSAGFIVYGVHKDGLPDPMGVPFIDERVVASSRAALSAAGIRLKDYPLVIASKAEARAAFASMKKDDEIDCVILFSGTWVWAAHLVGAIRDFAMSGKAVLLWTHPGSRGWRPVGGAGGLSVRLVCKVGEGALARLGRVSGELRMTLVRCTVFEPPAASLPKRLEECGIPFWPHGFVTAHADMDALLESWTNEYACLGYGKGAA